MPTVEKVTNGANDQMQLVRCDVEPGRIVDAPKGEMREVQRRRERSAGNRKTEA
jgi:hypothetical protein